MPGNAKRQMEITKDALLQQRAKLVEAKSAGVKERADHEAHLRQLAEEIRRVDEDLVEINILIHRLSQQIGGDALPPTPTTVEPKKTKTGKTQIGKDWFADDLINLTCATQKLKPMGFTDLAKTICEKYPKKLTFSTASRAASLICPYLARTGVFVKQRDGRSITYKFNEKEVQREQLNAFLDAERKRQIELERGVLN